MKQIEVVIRKERFPAVDLALRNLGVELVTMTEGGGSLGPIWSVTSVGQSLTYAMEYGRRAIISMFVEDGDVDGAVEAIASSASTGSLGDGKIVISPVERAVDIATAGPLALCA